MSKNVCTTRWLEKFTAINEFVELFPFVVDVVVVLDSNIIYKWNDSDDTYIDANILL